jgi:Zn-dependent M28 family amino/carboxypeptidase
MTIRRASRRLAVLMVAAVACAAQAPLPAGFDGNRAFDHLREIVAFGPRPAGSAALGETRRYISAQLAKLGLKTTEQAFDATTPIGRLHMVNLSAVIPGSRPERLIIAGHYDTKLYREFRFVGANDGGSSAAFLLELARVLKPRKNPFTVELLFLDGEEATLPDWTGNDHTYGSRHYVEIAKRDGTLGHIKALILVDMIGDRQLTIRRELNSTSWLTDIFWNSARRLKLDGFLDETMAIEDDHVPFLQAGVAAVDLIDLEYPAWHTAGDTLDKVSARSLETVGKVMLDALPQVEARLLKAK